MKTIKIGNDAAIPALGLGTWKADEGAAYDAVREAIAAGYRHIDCAAIYGNEVEIGRALRDAMAHGAIARHDLWITSKLWNNAHKKADVRPALEKTLKDLHLDYLDLYLIHWPVALRPGVGFPQRGEDFLSLDEAPLADTWQALETCVEAGLVRHPGVSNFSHKKLAALLQTAHIRPVMNQVEMHPYLQQQELVHFCHQNQVQLTAYSPLGSSNVGRLEPLKAQGEMRLSENETIVDIADKHHCSWAQVLLAWAMERGTCAIPKSVHPERIRQNLAAMQVELDDDDMARLGELDRHFRFVDGTAWTPPGSGYTLQNLWDE